MILICKELKTPLCHTADEESFMIYLMKAAKSDINVYMERKDETPGNKDDRN